MNPGTAKKLGEHNGKVIRWGAGGFGFIQCRDLSRDVYFKASAVASGEPAVGDEVEFVVLEYPGDKLVARDVRIVGAPPREAPASRPRVGAPLAGRIRGLEALVSASKPSATQQRAAEKPRAVAAAPSQQPDSLGVAVRMTEERERARATEARASAQQAQEKARAASSGAETARSESERRRRELERQLADLELDTRRHIEQLERSHAEQLAEAEALHLQAARLEQGIDQAVAQIAAGYLTTARDAFQAALARRERALVDLAGARLRATETAGADRVAKYEEIRRRALEAKDPDQREAFSLLEGQRREPMRAYAEALDASESAGPLDAPFWLVGDCLERGSAIVVAPYELSATQGDGSVWRLHSAVLQATHRLLHEMGRDRGALTEIERATVAGCFALRLGTLDTDLLPLLLEDALAERPTLLGLGLRLRFEEHRQVSPQVEVTTAVVESLDMPGAVGHKATGGPTRDVARRLGMDLDELVETLVANGLPFDDDMLSPEAEETVHALRGVSAAEVEEATTEPAPAPEPPAIDPVLDVAGRMLAKLLRAHVIGGKHTRIENAYGHHFADGEKARAREVAEALIRLGVLMEKQNMGSRHVFIDPRMVGVARDLAAGRCQDRGVIEGLLASVRS